jgi:transcriptional antiterminator RfaH
MTQRWYVIRTKRASELSASIRITEQGFETLCPVLQCFSFVKGKRIEGPKPLFPSHIFARFDRERDFWVPIKNTRGVAEILSDPNGNPVALRDKHVDAIRKRDGEIDAAILRIKALTKDDRVRIEEGPFRDWVGLFERHEPGHRVRVLLDILGRGTSISLCKSAISAVA